MKNLVIGIILGALIATVNQWTFDDEVAQEKLYCEMNSGGLWYDSQERYSKICNVEPSGGTGKGEMGNEERPDVPQTVTFTF